MYLLMYFRKELIQAHTNRNNFLLSYYPKIIKHLLSKNPRHSLFLYHKRKKGQLGGSHKNLTEYVALNSDF